MDLNIAILDALADDFESSEQIKKYLCFLGFDISLDNLEKRIQNLLNAELIYVVENISDADYTWYGMTKKGKTLWLQQD